MRKLLSFVVIGFALAATGCTSFIKLNVQAFRDPDVAIAAGATFSTFVSPKAENPLLQKELLAQIRSHLEAKGLRFVQANPDFYVMAFGTVSYEGYVPPKTTYIPIPGTTTTTTQVKGNVGGVPVYGTAQSTAPTTSYIPITSAGHNEYSRVIDVIIARLGERNGTHEAQEVWRGMVTSSGSTGDLGVVAPVLLRELFTEFPIRSGRSPDRQVTWTPPWP
jgi:Domain of unknown function (DUF4136)